VKKERRASCAIGRGHHVPPRGTKYPSKGRTTMGEKKKEKNRAGETVHTIQGRRQEAFTLGQTRLWGVSGREQPIKKGLEEIGGSVNSKKGEEKSSIICSEKIRPAGAKREGGKDRERTKPLIL